MVGKKHNYIILKILKNYDCSVLVYTTLTLFTFNYKQRAAYYRNSSDTIHFKRLKDLNNMMHILFGNYVLLNKPTFCKSKMYNLIILRDIT